MKIDNYNKDGNVIVGNHVKVDSFVTNVISIIVGSCALLLGIVIGFFTLLSYKQDNKVKNYLPIEAEIVAISDDEMDFYTISYEIDGKKYVNDDIFSIEGDVGDKIEILYNPNNPQEISWGDKKSNYMLIIITVFFSFLGLITIINNVKKILHRLNPQKYGPVNNEESMGITIGSSASNSNFDENDSATFSDGNTTSFKF